MIKNIILILLTVLSIIFGTLYIQEKEYSKRLEGKIQKIFITKINILKYNIKEICIDLESASNYFLNKEYVNLLQVSLEQVEKIQLLEEKYQSNEENIDIKIWQYRNLLNSYKDLKTHFEDIKDMVVQEKKMNFNIPQYDKKIDSKSISEIIIELIKKYKNEENNETENNETENNETENNETENNETENNETENNETENNETENNEIENNETENNEIENNETENNETENNETENNETERNERIENQREELDAERSVEVVFSNSNIKSEEENTTLEKLFDKLENDLNIYSTKTMKRVPNYNLLKFVRESKKNIKKNKTREMIFEFIMQKMDCINLENIYKSRQDSDIRVIKRKNKNLLGCYRILSILTDFSENTFAQLVVEYENFSSDFNNLGEKDLLYFRSIVKTIDMLYDEIAMEKKWISLKVKDLEIKLDEI